jgi:hypothetical protein
MLRGAEEALLLDIVSLVSQQVADIDLNYIVGQTFAEHIHDEPARRLGADLLDSVVAADMDAATARTLDSVGDANVKLGTVALAPEEVPIGLMAAILGSSMLV